MFNQFNPPLYHMADVEFVFDNDDLLRGKLVEPGVWYRLKIGPASQKLSKDSQSTNVEVPTRIIKNADTGDTEYAGVPITLRFNSKAKGFAIGFFASLGAEPTADKPFSFTNADGREIEAFIERKEYEGRLSNTCEHKYRTAA